MRKYKSKRIWILPMVVIFAFILLSCDPEFDPPNLINTQRFLGIKAEPFEVAPGGTITFSALVVNEDGTPYDGAVAFFVTDGSDLRDSGEGDVNPADALVQLPDQAPPVWTVPSKEEIVSQYGGMQKNGIVLAVAAAAGDLENDPLIAFKMFVISERAEKDRFENPVIEKIEVTEPGGNELAPGEDEKFTTDESKLHLNAVPDEDGDLTYHWFSEDKDFEPDFGPDQTFNPGNTGEYNVYLVMRERFYFIHDDDSRTMITGLDWQELPLVFE